MDGELWSKFLKNGIQGRLCGGAKDCGGAIVLDQLGDRPDAGTQVGEGEHLGFVKDQDALGQIMELSAFGRLAGIKGSKELDCCGDHHRNIPSLCRSDQRIDLRIGCIIRLQIEQYAGVRFQNIFIAQDLPKSLGGLLDDRRIGDHINDPLHSVGFGLRQGKGQG